MSMKQNNPSVEYFLRSSSGMHAHTLFSPLKHSFLKGAAMAVKCPDKLRINQCSSVENKVMNLEISPPCRLKPDKTLLMDTKQVRINRRIMSFRQAHLVPEN